MKRKPVARKVFKPREVFYIKSRDDCGMVRVRAVIIGSNGDPMHAPWADEPTTCPECGRESEPEDQA